jgi:hypothetical protein
MRKKQILALTAVAMVAVTFTAVVGVIGVTRVSAQVATLLSDGKVPAIITNLAAKFNVSTTDVQKVFDDTKTQLEDARLIQLVTDGKITETQKTLIVAKRNEIETKISEINNKQLTVTERAAALAAIRKEVATWATENKIDEMYVMGGGMGRGKGGMGSRGMGGEGMDGGFGNGGPGNSGGLNSGGPMMGGQGGPMGGR